MKAWNGLVGMRRDDAAILGGRLGHAYHSATLHRGRRQREQRGGSGKLLVSSVDHFSRGSLCGFVETTSVVEL